MAILRNVLENSEIKPNSQHIYRPFNPLQATVPASAGIRIGKIKAGTRATRAPEVDGFTQQVHQNFAVQEEP